MFMATPGEVHSFDGFSYYPTILSAVCSHSQIEVNTGVQSRIGGFQTTGNPPEGKRVHTNA